MATTKERTVRENPRMTEAGYVAVARVAAALGKSVQSIHLMAERGEVETLKEGHVTYVSVVSLERCYSDNHVMLAAVSSLRRKRGAS